MQIFLKRAPAWADIFRSYKIFLDGVEVGKIKQGQTWVGTCSTGVHSLQLRIDWCQSGMLEFEIEPDQEKIEFECHSNVNPLLGPWALFKYRPPSEWIALKRLS